MMESKAKEQMKFSSPDQPGQEKSKYRTLIAMRFRFAIEEFTGPMGWIGLDWMDGIEKCIVDWNGEWSIGREEEREGHSGGE